jgi:hypothetical protein
LRIVNVDYAGEVAKHGSLRWYDRRLWHLGRIRLSHEALRHLAELHALVGELVAQGALAPGQIDSPRHHDLEPHWGIPAIPYDANGRWDGSALIVWDSGNDTPPVENINPRDGGDSKPDPHGHPRVDPDAMLQMSLFLQTGGWIQDVCLGGPCLTMQNPHKEAPYVAD